VRNVGRDTSTTRTADETQIARFWSYDDRLGTPVRLYNQNTREILTQRPRAPALTILHTHARIFALVNLAMADAGIGCWDGKYAYNLWRPIHGITRADEDNNPSTPRDASWRPLGRPQGPVPNTTPPFPAYPSGHSSFGTATFAMLRKAYGGNNVSFALSSEEPNSGGPRNYTTFQSAINENGQSRIFLGVHFQFDNTQGRTLGQQVADHIWPNFLRPIG
jgi:membrane-associated phospholipid phosphatase